MPVGDGDGRSAAHASPASGAAVFGSARHRCLAAGRVYRLAGAEYRCCRLRTAAPRRPPDGLCVDGVPLSGLVVVALVPVAMSDGDLARLGAFGHRDVQPQDPVTVGRLDPVGVEVFAEH
ncbi:Uncharacterised protein [Mycobacterium xenopi]|nr:Uncharacterised protein [Mycobacterium xenopi]